MTRRSAFPGDWDEAMLRGLWESEGAVQTRSGKRVGVAIGVQVARLCQARVRFGFTRITVSIDSRSVTVLSGLLCTAA